MHYKDARNSNLCVVLIKKVNNPNVVFERHNVRFRIGLQVGEICGRGVKGTEETLGESHGVELQPMLARSPAQRASACTLKYVLNKRLIVLYIPHFRESSIGALNPVSDYPADNHHRPRTCH